MDKDRNNKSIDDNSKNEQLEQFRVQNTGKPLTTNQSKKLSNDADQLKAGIRGPTLRQDFEYFEKMTHFLHEEVPERGCTCKRLWGPW